jgi:flagellar basal-body rod modification protein FlgD
MTVASLPATTTTLPGAPRRTGAETGLIESDFQTFLRMLTVQLQNQDPLDPIDNSEYAVQLATFSGVEQQVKTNELLSALGGQLGLMGMSDLAGWVGRQALADMPVWFEGSPVALSLPTEAGADRAELVIRDGAGSIVGRDTLAPGVESLEWSGTGEDGLPLPKGRYTLSLESYAGDRLISTLPVESYAEILEARGGASGDTTLLFRGGVEVAAGKVTALRTN